MPNKITTIALDADDTLWENEAFFLAAQAQFTQLVAPFADKQHAIEHLTQAELRNVPLYGFGVKGFTLSMIETAHSLSGGKIGSDVIAEMIALAREMLGHPMHVKLGVVETLSVLAQSYDLVMITKGDLLHQERKIDQSGLKDYFKDLHIVSEKEPRTYRSIFGNQVENAVMVGNSLKSDIIPALTAGSYAVHIPAQYEWALEAAPAPTTHDRFFEATQFSELGEIVSRI